MSKQKMKYIRWIISVVLLICTVLCSCDSNGLNESDRSDNGYSNSGQNNNNSNGGDHTSAKSAPSISQIISALEAQGYTMERQYDEEGDMSAWPDGAVRDYFYYGGRYFDENGRIISPENADDYHHGEEYLQMMYIQFEDADSARQAFIEARNEALSEGHSVHSGENWDRAWVQSSSETTNSLVSRIDNMVLIIFADWDDYDDMEISYNNDAIKVMEKLGF